MTKPDDLVSILVNPQNGDILSRGLTKREYFAATILQGFLSYNSGILGDSSYIDRLTLEAVNLADVLIHNLNEVKE